MLFELFAAISFGILEGERRRRTRSPVLTSLDCKESVFLRIQVHASSHTKGVERGGKRRARLGRDAKNMFFLSRLIRPTGNSLRGRRSKGKGKGIRARDHARGRRFPSLLPRAPLAFLSRLKLPCPKLPFPSLSKVCHAGYTGV